MSRISFFAAASVLTLLVACAPAESNVDADVAAQQGAVAYEPSTGKYIVGSVGQGGSLTLTYDPELHYAHEGETPLLGVELLPATGTGDLSISVDGAFPGVAEVSVVDENFNVIVSSTPDDVQQEGDRVTVKVPASTAKRFVLVTDHRWTSPMQFDVGVAQL